MPAIDKGEVLRYLGYKGQALAPDLSALIDQCIASCMQTATPRVITRRFACAAEGEDGVRVLGAALFLRGRDICRHLEGCGDCVLMAATLGVATDNLIKRYESTDLTRSVLLDACATALIESVCDQAEEAVRRQAEEEGKGITSRYSPGYGDLPLDTQPGLTAVLDTPRRIGLCCSEAHLLIPRKSVTAVIGIRAGSSLPPPRRGCGGRCADCGLVDCLYRKEENRHGN